ncbi:hypothetical protein ACSXC4_03470 [Clostridium perfringens]|uniref:hypothetical protein n=1 Tax=Clostridium TaxID=1485 RepID=UPI001300CC6E|nr:MULTISPECIES: hypothetical protein [Clostridium]MDK7627771.1 hypothetical protein [Clostridium sp. UMB9555A]HBC2029776.1 hypothetical protein [Clostridium perfringens]HBC2032853.1 hypothetical protein [Clostridium perfringens]HBC2055082.1 hypothetical protein [Clostridium perfringens]HBC2069806.1 hypothetical protein [Clostridium perfringens]
MKRLLKRILIAIRKLLILKENKMLYTKEELEKREEELTQKLNRKVVIVDFKTDRIIY